MFEPRFSEETKYPKSVVAVSTSPANDDKGDKNNVEVKRELNSLRVSVFIGIVKEGKDKLKKIVSLSK